MRQLAFLGENRNDITAHTQLCDVDEYIWSKEAPYRNLGVCFQLWVQVYGNVRCHDDHEGEFIAIDVLKRKT